jgi:DNA polymerase III delta prime subunit
MSEGQEAQKYFERLNIAVLSINRIKELVKTHILNVMACWDQGRDVLKQAFHILGPAGVGKTEICLQISDELTKETGKQFDQIKIQCPVLSRDDFLIPFPVTRDGEQRFKMLYSDFIPTDPESYGIYIIDEFSRGDHNLQQLLWQVQNENKIHLYPFPKGWFVISLDNPDDAEYSVDQLEDAAGLRRMLHLYVEVSPQDFLNHAIGNGFHSLVVEFIQSHPDYLYDFDAQKRGSVYANPASFERVSNILWGYEARGGISASHNELDFLISGLLNVNMTRLFMEFARERKDINPRDVFNDYPKVRKEVLKYVKDQNNAKLGELMVAFTTFVSTSRPDYTVKEQRNIVAFLTDIPIDTAALFVSQVDNFSRTSDEFRYITKLHTDLMKLSEKYRKDFYEPIVTVGKG